MDWKGQTNFDFKFFALSKLCKYPSGFLPGKQTQGRRLCKKTLYLEKEEKAPSKSPATWCKMTLAVSQLTAAEGVRQEASGTFCISLLYCSTGGFRL